MPVLSTLLTFNPMPTLTLILAPQSGPAHLDAILGDPFLHSLFQGVLNTHVLNYQLSLIDITAHLNEDARTTYTLDSDLASSLFSIFKKLIQVINCVGNNFNPNIDIISLPLNLPKDAVTSLNMPEPITSWGTLTHSLWNFIVSWTSSRCSRNYKTSQIFFLDGSWRWWRLVFYKGRVLSGTLEAILVWPLRSSLAGSTLLLKEIHTGTFSLDWFKTTTPLQPGKVCLQFHSKIPLLNLCTFEDFEFILNCTAYASDAQDIRHMHTCLLYRTEPYNFIKEFNTIDKFNLTEKLKSLSI